MSIINWFSFKKGVLHFGLWGHQKDGKNTMILSRLLAPGAAQLARCSHRKIHTSASRFGGHPRGIPARYVSH